MRIVAAWERLQPPGFFVLHAADTVLVACLSIVFYIRKALDSVQSFGERAKISSVLLIEEMEKPALETSDSEEKEPSLWFHLTNGIGKEFSTPCSGYEKLV